MSYTVRLARLPRRWALSVDELDGRELGTVTRLVEAEAAARERLGTVLDVAPSTLDIAVVIPQLGRTNVPERSRNLLAKRELAASLAAEIAKETDALVHELNAADIPYRDIAALVGVGLQRVEQILNPKTGQ